MNKSIGLLLVFLLGYPQAFAIGGDVGNGGDAVRCKASNANTFVGYYSLDYLAQYQNADDILAVQNLEASLNRIEGLLKSKLPELVDSFKLFHKNLLNTADASQIHLWEKASFGLIDLKDEKLVTLLPENCLENGKISIVQAAIKIPPVISGRPLGFYLYKYMPDVFEKMESTNPVQLSFLIVHEWLWQHSNSVDRNRRVNYWLHSKIFQNSTRDEDLKFLEGVGFSVPTMQPPFFNVESCKADEEEYMHLIDFTEKKMYSSNKFTLGYGRFLYRQQLCDSATSTCGNYNYYNADSAMAKSFFDQSIFIEIDKNRITVNSRDSGAPAHQHFTCEIDFYTKKIKDCSEYILSSGYPYAPALRFDLTVGRGCIRFTSKNAQPQYGTVFTADEKVLFVTTVTF